MFLPGLNSLEHTLVAVAYPAALFGFERLVAVLASIDYIVDYIIHFVLSSFASKYYVEIPANH